MQRESGGKEGRGDGGEEESMGTGCWEMYDFSTIVDRTEARLGKQRIFASSQEHASTICIFQPRTGPRW